MPEELLFDFVLFPLSVEDFVGGVSYLTVVLKRGNGGEQRIGKWDDGLPRFDGALGVRSLTDFQTLHSFHRRRKGKLRGFMVRNLLDYTVTNELPLEGVFGEGDGTTADFYLKKTYTDYTESDPVYGETGNTETRRIYLPEHGTVTITVDGIEQEEGVDYTLNYKNGKVTFLAGHIPADEAVLEWTGRFFEPVRFVEDDLPTEEFKSVMKLDPVANEYFVDKAAGPIPNVAMVGVRDLEHVA